MAQRVQAAKARKDFAALIERTAKGERIKVTRYGTTLAALIPKKDLQKLEECEGDEQPSAPPPPHGRT
ncbi:MAG TPA: type II toxin-antitoxin system prevent-host-death family antitoxin [Polyangia bacterium]|nr:type II toxin-antitoxin system prevent-host-death family antitoxin [Polyangia bacterium]